ncbi:oligosaccharide flippase family protein [Caldifermentibacillus hisashii]|uniref:oligosaccharide flippase family protein n=1 Tax=Caldifermentibacillus hisashii TaxID=996558 RepID=UPI000BA3B8A5|nr:oligosaccharide flippase family protein [Caldifermentibacillus hisashii]PAC34376.1 hypothetical protein CEJ87_13705 [Caldifermentibacillus hisashii]
MYAKHYLDSKNSLKKNSIWMIYGLGSRITLQTIYFFMLAKVLGPQGYGAFTAIIALTSILVPFSGFGFGNIMIKYVSTNKILLREYYGKALSVLLLTGFFINIIVVSIAAIILDNKVSLLSINLISITEIILLRIIEINTQVFISIEKMKWSAHINMLISLFRLFAVIVFVCFFKEHDIVNWSIIYFFATLALVFFSLLITVKTTVRPFMTLKGVRKELKEGIYFSVGLSSQSVYNDLDKTILGKFGDLSIVGIYSAAYKIIDMAFTPAKAVLSSTYSKFFQYGRHGISQTSDLLFRIIKLLLIYSIIVLIGLLIFSPTVELLLGDRYNGLANIILSLSVLPILRSIHYSFADALTGAGYQKVRSINQVLVAFINGGLSLLLIQIYSWRGAVTASIISDGILCILLITNFYYIKFKERKT